MILKLKRTPGIYLVGFMGSGKSTVGRLLADRLGWPFADLDAEIEGRERTTILAIFETRGEDEFRRLEREALQRHVRRIESGHPCVMALGGGAVAQPGNYELIENNGVTIWLDCPFEIVQRRVAPASHRPLARDPETFAQLYESRRGSYARADYRIPIEGDDPKEAVEAVMRLPLFR